MNKRFAFLIHARDLDDFFIKFPYLKFLPRSWVLALTRNMPPIIVSRIIGHTDHNGAPLEGLIIGITMTAHQMLEDRELALKRMREAVKLAEKNNVGIIGLGGLNASLSKGGHDLIGLTNVGVTTGRIYTVKTVTDYVLQAIQLFRLNKEDIRVGIVGASGSIGSGCFELLAEHGIKKFLLVDIERKSAKIVHDSTKNLDVIISHRISDIKDADIIIAATNAPEAVIRPDDLSPGAIIINDAQPSDVAPEVYNRDDVVVVEGGVISSKGIAYNVNMGLASKEDIFCCLGEVLILAHNHHFSDYAIGSFNKELVGELKAMSQTLPITLARLQNKFGYISTEKIERIKNILSEKTLS